MTTDANNLLDRMIDGYPSLTMAKRMAREAMAADDRIVAISYIVSAYHGNSMHVVIDRAGDAREWDEAIHG
jgi:hypothetical protein